MLQRIIVSLLMAVSLLLPLHVHAATIQLPASGQTTSYAAGDDGALKTGAAWPNPRFTDNGNGTVTDNLTELIWLKNASCFGTRTWADALEAGNTLSGNNFKCGLNDGSVAGQWRLPNRKELQSLIDHSRYNPALPTGHPFSIVQANVYWSVYWSSSSDTGSTDNAWYVNMLDGNVLIGSKSTYAYVWPVRSGQ